MLQSNNTSAITAAVKHWLKPSILMLTISIWILHTVFVFDSSVSIYIFLNGFFFNSYDSLTVIILEKLMKSDVINGFSTTEIIIIIIIITTNRIDQNYL